MKFGQLLSVVLIAGIVGIATNVGYEYFTTEKPHPDRKKFKAVSYTHLPSPRDS